MTRDGILTLLPNLPDRDVDDLAAAANADAGEGAEWLPYYKMALERLIECCAMLRGMVTPNDHRIYEAAALYYQHLLFCGIGPVREEGHVRRCEEVAVAAMAAFVESARKVEVVTVIE